MKQFDKLAEKSTRMLAQRTARRGLLGKLAATMVGVAALPLLPVARAASGNSEAPSGYPGVSPQDSMSVSEIGDPASCDYWRYCGIGGPLCACCGGSANACPPGTEMSPLSWVGTCLNPADGKKYIISYNDCCGKPTCKRCFCSPHNPNDRPVVWPQSSNNYLWCLGTKESSFTCSTANVLGLALDQN